MLFRPGPAVLWAAATDASQSELKRRIAVVQDEVARTIEEIIASPVFNVTYRPMLRAILTDAVSNAWEDVRTQAALSELLATSRPALERLLAGDFQSIVVGRVNDAVWDMLQTNWLNAFGVPLGYELDYAPVLRAITDAIADPRVQEVFVAFGSDRLATDEARRLAERIAIGVIDSLLRDPRVPEVVQLMLTDPALREMVRPLSEAAVGLVGALPRHLGGLGAESTLNPLAAHVFRAMVLGEDTPLILFVTEEDRLRIERLEPDGVTFLRPVDLSNRT